MTRGVDNGARDRAAGRMEGWMAGRLGGWEAGGGPGSGRCGGHGRAAGRLEGWKAGRLEGWKVQLGGWGAG